MEFPATLKNHVNVLVCPTCGGGLAQTNDALFCAPCNANYPVRNGKIYFVAPPPHKTTASDIKHGLRRLLGNKYNKAVRILGPGFPINKKKLLFESIDNQAGLVVDLGSGTGESLPGSSPWTSSITRTLTWFAIFEASLLKKAASTLS